MGARSPSQGIAGSLQDVAVADVLQFIHLGRRTGILRLERGSERATIGFFQGRIISAQATGAPRVGDLLLRKGLVYRQRLEAALATQGQGAARRSLGQVLLNAGILTPAQLKAVLEEQIRQAIASVLAWSDGEFEFLPDDLTPLDEVTLYPSDVLPEAEVDTDAVLHQAQKVFAAKNEQEQVAPATPKAPEILDGEELSRVLSRLEEHGSGQGRVEVQVLTPDDGFFARLAAVLRGEATKVVRVDPEHAGEGAPPTLVLLDARQGILGPGEVSTLRRRQPGLGIVVVVHPGQPVAPFLRAGASMVIPPELEAAVACVASLREKPLPPAESPGALPESTLLRLRQAFGELRPGFVAASLALHLLQILSESVARAVMLLVKERDLTVLGAFGRDARGQLLAHSTRKLRLAVGSAGLLDRAVLSAEVVRGAHRDLPEPLRTLMGPAARDEVVVFPVRGIQRVIALVVADNGDRPEPIASWEIVELAAEQAGMAFENELLRRKLAERASSAAKGERP